MKFRLVAAIILIAYFGNSAKAQQIPLDPAVRTGKLANGFTYYIRHNEEPKNRVVFYLANKVGSILEADDQRGLAHFMEHMSFNGTKHFPKNELVNYLQKAGVRFGADINAYTSYDETVYQLPLPSNDPEILKNGIEIMHDWAHGATLDPQEINNERGVVLEEKRLGKGAAERVRAKYFPVITNGSSYASRNPIGTDEVLNNFKPEAIRRFYRDWYRPDLQAIIVVGDVDVHEMEKTIKTKFSDLVNPPKELPRTIYKVDLTGKNQFIAVTDPEVTTISAQVINKFPEVPLHTIPEFRQSMVRQLFNQMLGERYSELKQQADPPFLQGGAGISGFVGGLESFGVFVTAKPGELERGFKAVWRENERVRRLGFIPTELERVKHNFLNRFESALSERNKIRSDSYVQEYLQYFLHGTASAGIVYEEDLVKKILPTITLDDVNKLAMKVNDDTNRDIVLTASETAKATLPNEAVINNWIKAVESENIAAFKDVTSKETLLRKEPIPGRIMDQRTDHKSGITTLLLSNGIKVLLKPTSFKNNQIVFTGFAPGGTSIYSDADFQSATAANIIPSYGAGNHSPLELSKYLSDKQLAIQLSISERSQNISGSSVNKDLEAALQLMYAYITEPRQDSLLFKGMIANAKAALANRQNDPNTVFQDTISSVLGDHNVRRTGPTLKKLEQVKLDRAYKIYKELFAGNQGFTFVFVGNIDTLTIFPLLAKYVASLPVTTTILKPRDLNIDIPPGQIEKRVYKGTEPKASVSLVFSGAFDYNFTNALIMDALKEALQIRLIERLREDEGGVYAPSVTMGTSKKPQPRFNMTVNFGCAPENVEKLIASTIDEITKVKTSGPLPVNIEKFKAETQRSLETTLKTNGFWLTYLARQLQNEEALNEVDTYTEKLSAITTKDVQNAAKKYLTGKNYIKLILIPEKIEATK
ncbi:insulinase family protein [Mucilaginibacter corticis]|uniref:Insulinase family protein n=1 Tax=Mucilaginibacter corticis TaxID=2597670 RepID=A0A556MX72_9SPHI|nr:M16 family metallopeptidase [Mucilaginibacter corticis]TSJ44482.1 insulinase family protein [Mucilaginibacter corticis]